MSKTNYTVDRDNKTIVVERTFNAPVDIVWRAWTDSEILDKWWAPKPWKAETKSQEFREGGRWLYAMKGPGGETHWSLADYLKIQPTEYFTAQDAFCDDAGNVNSQMPSTHWHNAFTAAGDMTNVTTTMTFESTDALDTLVKMGFKEGFAMGHDNLDEYLATNA